MKEIEAKEKIKEKWEAPELITFDASTLTQAGNLSITSETNPATQTAAAYDIS